ncbi:MAG: hypothetical protein ACOCQW_00905 [Halanaerobiaceae bacterium]
MILADLIFAILIALLLTWALGLGMRKNNRIGSIIIFIILMLFIWAGGVWIAPVGPLIWGVPWVSFLLIGIFFALLIAALTPEHRYRKRRQKRDTTETFIIIDAFFWILLAGLGLAILISYL